MSSFLIDVLVPVSIFSTVVASSVWWTIKEDNIRRKHQPAPEDKQFYDAAVIVATTLGEDDTADDDWRYADGKIVVSYYGSSKTLMVDLGAVKVYDGSGWHFIGESEKEILYSYMIDLMEQAIRMKTKSNSEMRASVDAAIQSILLEKQ